jgi:uncharacterized damage-inducible protein DinB
VNIGKPAATEFAPLFARYIARVGDDVDPRQELSAQRSRVMARLSRLSEQRAEFRYASDKWSIKEVVGHLSDCERVFAYRLLTIARGDTAPLPGFDENDYARAAHSHQRPFNDLVDEWAVVRDGTLTLSRSLAESDWTMQGTANGAPTSARALLYVILGHTEHHLNVLAERYTV